ncbi:MAG: hypothetical protein E7638_01790 [Ruminococcaceae bacterium]|nr:hypothetical protein [Oscillospiraceae bacterium]
MSRRMIDFHSHMLPDVDDGSRSTEQSLEMIEKSAEQGVDCIVFTPHFYALHDDPTHFLRRRQESFERLKQFLPEESPKLLCGAEVRYFDGLVSMEELPQMRIEGSSCLLVEMPFRKWQKREIGDILDLCGRKEYTVILAHIERYLGWNKLSVVEEMVSAGAVIQANGDFFLGGFRSRTAIRMINRGLIHVLGSDAHNTTERPPNLGSAYDVIEKKCGKGTMDDIYTFGARLLNIAPSERVNK